jgi:hypothetical protein
VGPDLTVWDILDLVEVDPCLGDLNPAPHIPGTVEGLAIRIRNRHPIDGHLIVVKAWILRCRHPCEEAIFSLGEVSAKDPDALSLRSADTEVDPPLCIDAGPILADDSG